MDHCEACRRRRICAEVDARMTPDYVEGRLRMVLFIAEVYAYLEQARRGWPTG